MKVDLDEPSINTLGVYYTEIPSPAETKNGNLTTDPLINYLRFMEDIEGISSDSVQFFIIQLREYEWANNTRGSGKASSSPTSDA